MTSLSLLAGRTVAPRIPLIKPVLTYRMESSEDPDQLASENQADLELNCFQTGYMSCHMRFMNKSPFTVLPAKSDSDFMFCLQDYQGLIIDRSLVY